MHLAGMSEAVRRRMPAAILMLLSTATSVASADSAPYAPQLDSILRNLEKTLPAEQCAQIIGAVNASPALAHQLEDLVSHGRLTAIRVSDPLPAPKGPMFDGAIVGSSIYFSSRLLTQLRNNHLLDVRNDSDLAANNTVFALGDLAYLLSSEPDRAAARSLDLDSFVQKAMTRKALALLQDWNDVIDAANRANNNKTPTPGQIGTLLLNMRYGGVFRQALKASSGSLLFLPSGMIDENESNAAALVSVLRNTPVMDLE